MAYTDYEFYSDTYYGTVVSEDDFDKYAELASDRVDAMTFDRLVYNYPSDSRADKKIQKAVCAVADILYRIDVIRQAAMDAVGVITNSDGTVTSKAVTGISSGSESISFSSAGSSSTSESSIYEAAASDSDQENSLIMRAAGLYLNGVRDSNGTLVLYGGFN